MKGYFLRESFMDKTPQKIISRVIKSKLISNEGEVMGVLCPLLMPTATTSAICTNKEVIYFESGGFFPKSNKYPLSSITAVTIENHKLGEDFVVITIGGGEKKVFEIITGKQDAIAFGDLINSLINQKSSDNSAPISPADELKKFKELFDLGVITQEEFDAKKKQLLSI
jgi:hypothetical protein